MPNPIQAKQVNTTDGTISTVNAGDTSTEGTGKGLSRRDHEHAVATGGATDEIGADNTAAEGSSTNLAREDHVHEVDTTTGSISTVNAGDSAAEGSANGISRRDHQHAVATAAPSTVSGATNSEGSSSSLARADHGHRLEVTVEKNDTPVGSRPAINFIEGSNITITVTDDGANEEVDVTIASSAAGTPRQEAVTTENITGTDTALSDTLDNTPTSNASVELFLNGVLQIQGSGEDYTISGSTITWLANTGTAVDMETTDDLIAVYES